MSDDLKKLIDDAFDKARGIDDAANAKIADAVRAAYPGRSEKTLERICDHVKTFWTPDADAFRAHVVAVERYEPGLTRRTPTVADVVAWRESEAKSKGLPWGPEAKIAAHRAATAMDDEEKLAFVPADFKIMPPAEVKPANASRMSETEHLDAEILARTGRDPRQMLVSERQRWHAELRNILAAPTSKTEGTIPPLDPSNPERARERINTYRRAQGAK